MKLSTSVLVAASLLAASSAFAQSTDNQGRMCSISLNKAESDLEAVLKNTHLNQAFSEMTIEDLKKKNAEQQARIKELEDKYEPKKDEKK